MLKTLLTCKRRRLHVLGFCLNDNIFFMDETCTLKHVSILKETCKQYLHNFKCNYIFRKFEYYPELVNYKMKNVPL